VQPYDPVVAAARRSSLTRLMWLSIVAAVTTIGLKTVAWQITGSVGLLSDALESLVNLGAAVTGLVLLRWAASPPDRRHMFGHDKAEYFSAGIEGTLILVAAVAIGWTAVRRLLDPAEIDSVGAGAAVSGGASLVNLGVGLLLVREGGRQRSITVEADGRHLLTDVWTSAGVIAGVIAVAATGWRWLDPVIALAVASNIVRTGTSLLRRAGGGLMDQALPDPHQEALERVLARYRDRGIGFHAVRTRQAGRRSFVTLHVLVPGDWSVRRGHELAERLEEDIGAVVPDAAVTTHLEPAEDPASLRDAELDRSPEHDNA
jgi:cation diffusion facilitator family transporter